MNARTAPLSDPPPPDAPAPVGAARDRARIERQLRMLDDLAEMGMALAQALVAQATATPAEADDRLAASDIALAYDRIARSVRLTIALQSRLLEDAETVDRRAASDAGHRRAAVRRIVGRVARAQHDNERVVIHIEREARERLEHDDIYGDINSVPFSELVARLCKDLGLSPDWPRLAQEAWAQAEMTTDHPGAPLAALIAGRARTRPPPDGEPRPPPRSRGGPETAGHPDRVPDFRRPA